MAEIKDGFYGYVGGTVVRTFEAKTGLAAVVETKDAKALYPDRVTVWGLKAGDVAEGDRVKVGGWLKIKPSTYMKKDGSGEGHGVDISLNSPKIVDHERGSVEALSLLGATEVDPDAPF